MSIFGNNGGGGSGLTPEQLAQLVDDGELSAAQAAIIAAIQSAMAAGVKATGLSDSALSAILAKLLAAGGVPDAVAAALAAAGVRVSALDNAARDAIAAAVAAQVKLPDEGRVYRYIASKVPTGLEVTPFFAGAQQGYDGLADFTSPSIAPGLMAHVYNPYYGLATLTFNESGYSNNTTVFCTTPTGLAGMTGYLYPQGADPLVAFQLEVVTDGTLDSVYMPINATSYIPGTDKILAAMKGGQAGNIQQVVQFTPIGIYCRAVGTYDIYVQAATNLDTAATVSGILHFRFAGGAVQSATLLKDAFSNPCVRGVHDVAGTLVLTDYVGYAYAVAADGSLTSIDLTTDGTYSHYYTPIGDKLYSTLDGKLFRANLTVTKTGAAVTGIAFSGSTRIFSAAEPIIPCPRGNTLVLLGRKGIYEVSNADAEPKLVQLVHPLLSQPNSVTIPIALYKSNDVDVLAGLAVSLDQQDANGFLALMTAVAYDYTAAKNACFVDVAKE